MHIRVDERQWANLSSSLLAEKHLESAGILLGEVIGTGAERVIAVRETKLVPDDGYEIRRPDQLRISPLTLNRLVRPARERGWSVLTIHTHGAQSPPQFSWADDQGDARLMPSFSSLIPGVPHGSMVLSSTGEVTARLFDGHADPAFVGISVVGRRLQRLVRAEEFDEPWFHRQRLALGGAGQAQLRRLRVAVVGAGGIGSVVAIELCHLGVGELLLVDGDVLEASNVSRVLASRVADVSRMPKVDLAARYIVESGLPVRVQVIEEPLNEHNVEALATADVILSCVDRHRPRALLNRLAYRALVPVIDTGTAFRIGVAGQLTGAAGRVVVVGPGRPCLNCWGHISPDALRVEALPQEERQALAAEGYVSGADVPEPSVVAFNAAVASHAVIELMRLVTGFAGADDPPDRLAFSFADGTVRRNRLAERHPCAICA